MTPGTNYPAAGKDPKKDLLDRILRGEGGADALLAFHGPYKFQRNFCPAAVLISLVLPLQSDPRTP